MSELDVLDHLRSAYSVLCDRVRIALRVQVGDEARLQHHISEVASYANAAEIVCLSMWLFVFRA